MIHKVDIGDADDNLVLVVVVETALLQPLKVLRAANMLLNLRARPINIKETISKYNWELTFKITWPDENFVALVVEAHSSEFHRQRDSMP